jgi:hypothetical protein
VPFFRLSRFCLFSFLQRVPNVPSHYLSSKSFFPFSSFISLFRNPFDSIVPAAKLFFRSIYELSGRSPAFPGLRYVNPESWISGENVTMVAINQ